MTYSTVTDYIEAIASEQTYKPRHIARFRRRMAYKKGNRTKNIARNPSNLTPPYFKWTTDHERDESHVIHVSCSRKKPFKQVAKRRARHQFKAGSFKGKGNDYKRSFDIAWNLY